ncbi:pectinesterase [Hydrogenispora ethanolica]|uniref:Pectinesterase n=1 Tax=Hydrogenispora ethanolica TaxID=1082276 RepID=A0A4V2QFK4_HYDET|nr:pectinesterase family protein [Hydrogenispora ethanolica]TCL72327.1 pectinesterase [Hydrogenispora ethanolica]
MKQKRFAMALLTTLLFCGSLVPLYGQEAPPTAKNAANLSVPANYILYIPGLKNATDAKADIEANGFQTTVTFNAHFSLVNDAAGHKLLKLNTLDAQNDVLTIPLDGTETKLTLIFKAKGAVVPDRGTPFGILWAMWQRGEYQSVLRHNASNQIKGSTGQTGLNPENIVSDWHDFRLVFDLAPDGKAMTASAFIDGKQRHQTANFEKKNGSGNFIQFGENDGSTNGLGRYPYLLLIKNEDVSGKSLAELSKIVGWDLEAKPVLVNDPDPVSKKPAKKPAGINLTAADASSKDPNYVDPSLIKDGVIDLAKLPYSKNAAQKVTANPKLPADLARIAAAIVEPSGANGAYRTIAAAIDAVKPGAVIYIKPGLYQEKLKITKPDLSLVGESPANTIIYGYEADYGNIDGNLLVEVNLAEAGYFTAENITFYNKGPEWNRTWDNVERRSITLATRNVQGGYLKNCIFLGQQDTMYLRSGRLYFENCYIEGEVDFICGGATVLFANCHIHSLYYKEGGYITAAAPSDTQGAGFNNGYVFKDCLLTVDPAMAAKNIYLGRGAWTGGSNGAPNPAKVVLISSALHGRIHPDAWTDWDNVNTAAKQFFREYQNSGEGATPVETATRRFLTDAEYQVNYSSPEKILGFTPKLPY